MSRVRPVYSLREAVNCMRNSILVFLLTAIVAAVPCSAQQTTPPPAAPNSSAAPSSEATPSEQTPPATTTTTTTTTSQSTPSTDQPPATPPVLSRAASGAYDRRDALPSVNVYVPEGQASIRLRKLIRNVLFESQIDYKFVTGDISTYLRYKYYAHKFTYKIGVFDSIEFPDIGAGSSQEFQRVRGGLLLTEFPRDYNHRYFWLLQDDRLTFGDVTQVDNKKNNVYTKLGFQYGTQFDERLNAIVGESRGRITPVLTAFRELGPQKFSLAAAVTESAAISTGDYKYTKLETEALRRWDITGTSFVVTRAHVGTFLTKSRFADRSNLPQIDQYTIPNYEMFALGGRDALKSVDTNDDTAGTTELHLTNEYFVPIFRNQNYHTWALNWNTLYGIGYLGAGTVGFETSKLTKVRDYVADAGIGAEASIAVRDFDVLISVIYAHTVHADDPIKGSKIRFSIRTIR
jgi:hypothetical protein